MVCDYKVRVVVNAGISCSINRLQVSLLARRSSSRAKSKTPKSPLSNSAFGVWMLESGPLKPDFGLSGAVRRLDKVLPPFVRVFGPSIPTRSLRILQRR